jgi:hypothetical protein
MMRLSWITRNPRVSIVLEDGSTIPGPPVHSIDVCEDMARGKIIHTTHLDPITVTEDMNIRQVIVCDRSGEAKYDIRVDGKEVVEEPEKLAHWIAFDNDVSPGVEKVLAVRFNI